MLSGGELEGSRDFAWQRVGGSERTGQYEMDQRALRNDRLLLAAHMPPQRHRKTDVEWPGGSG